MYMVRPWAGYGRCEAATEHATVEKAVLIIPGLDRRHVFESEVHIRDPSSDTSRVHRAPTARQRSDTRRTSARHRLACALWVSLCLCGALWSCLTRFDCVRVGVAVARWALCDRNPISDPNVRRDTRHFTSHNRPNNRQPTSEGCSCRVRRDKRGIVDCEIIQCR
jgi:hypothetical protein